jgi:hypothetical protein
MKSIEKLNKFELSNRFSIQVLGGAPIVTFSDCSSYSYGKDDKLCDSTTTRTDDNDRILGRWTQNYCTT